MQVGITIIQQLTSQFVFVFCMQAILFKGIFTIFDHLYSILQLLLICRGSSKRTCEIILLPIKIKIFCDCCEEKMVLIDYGMTMIITLVMTTESLLHVLYYCQSGSLPLLYTIVTVIQYNHQLCVHKCIYQQTTPFRVLLARCYSYVRTGRVGSFLVVNTLKFERSASQWQSWRCCFISGISFSLFSGIP